MSNEVRSALVTGAGTGIGRAVAERFAADGYAVGLAGRRREPLEQVAAGLPAERVVVIPGDVGTPEGAGAAVESVVSAFGGLDALICNHGVGDSAAVADDT